MRSRFAVALLLLAVALAVAPAAAKAQWRTSLLPVLGSAPETGGQFGLAVFRTRQPEDSLGTRPSSIIGNAIATSKGQQRAFVEYDGWTPGNERRLQVLAIASKFPLPFYGYGDDTPDEAQGYEPTTLDLSVTRSRKRGDALWRYVSARVVATRANLQGAESAGIPGADGYGLGLLTAGRIRDTRDNIFAPSRGRVLDLSVSAGLLGEPDQTINPNTLLRLRLDWRAYRPLPKGGVLASQVNIMTSGGGFPLDQIALVGHNTLNRGYTMGRYRDEGMLASQLEWRSPTRAMNGRLGMAAFGGLAFLFGDSDNGRPLPSGGAGLRFRLDPRTRSTIRVDYAKGASRQSGLYVAFNEAF